MEKDLPLLHADEVRILAEQSAGYVKHIQRVISNVVQNISHNMQSTKDNSQEILAGIGDTNKAIEQVAAIVAQEQAITAEKLTQLVLSFKI